MTRSEIPIVETDLHVPPDVLSEFVPVDAVNGMVFENKDAHVGLAIRNLSEGPVTVTVKTWLEHFGIEVEDLVHVFPHDPLACWWIGPFERRLFNKPGTFHVYVDFDRDNSVFAGVFRVSKI